MTGSAIMRSLLQRQREKAPVWPAGSTCFSPPPAGTDYSRTPSPLHSLRPQLPGKVAEGKEEEDWGEGSGGAPGLVGSSWFSWVLGRKPPTPQDDQGRFWKSCLL